MIPVKQEIITIPVTPKILRSIADDIEKRMEGSTPETVPGFSFSNGQVIVRLMGDLQLYAQHKAGVTSW